MALLFADSFDDRTTVPVGKWTSEGWASFLAGRTGNGARFSGTGNSYQDLPSTYATLIIGAAIKFQTTGSLSSDKFFKIMDGSTVQMYLKRNTSDKIEVRRGDDTLLATGTISVPQNTFYYIEFKCTINNSTGSYEVRVDGVADSTGSSADTQNSANAYATRIQVEGTTADSLLIFDDLYVCDTSGSLHNDFLSAVKIECLFPSGAGNTTQWTPSAGSNYQCVDEANANGNTDYVSDATVGNKDTYAMGNLAASTGTIKGIQVGVVAEKDDAVARSFCRVIRSGGTDYDGSSISPTNGVYTRTIEVVETDPATSAAWTHSGVNAMELGVKTTA